MHSRSSYQRGLFAEFLARTYLRLHGFRIVESRYITGRHTNRAEIDIIARRGKLLLFIEVKNRPSLSRSFDAITATQSARLRSAAETYIARIGWTGNARFDVISVSGYKINWIKNCI